MPDDQIAMAPSPVIGPERRRLQRDIETAWTEFLTTGLHVSATGADEWLRRLADGEDATIPQCQK